MAEQVTPPDEPGWSALDLALRAHQRSLVTNDRKGARFTTKVLEGIDWGDAPPKLLGADLSRADLREATLSRADLREAKLLGANLTEADLTEADLSGANLTKANPFRANLAKANLSGANLTKADLSGANLTGANLTKADLSGANLTRANLTGANLSGANLSGANLTGLDLTRANLAGANLTGADLSGMNLSGMNLSGANLSEADLTLARLIRVNLSGAIVDDANVRDAHVQELRGLPTPPGRLRLGSGPDAEVLTGEAAVAVFAPPSVVEVFLSRVLTRQELNRLRMKFAAVTCLQGDAGVIFLDARTEAGGTALRFQGPTYEAVYAALPDILAVFPTAAAINWEETIKSVSKEDRPATITALVKAEAQNRDTLLALLERVSDALNEFGHKRWSEDNVRVVRLNECGRRGVHITVVSDERLIQKLERAALPPAANTGMVIHGNPNFYGDPRMNTGNTNDTSTTNTNTTNNTTTTINAAGAQIGAVAIGGSTATNSGNQTMQVNAPTPPVDLATAVKTAFDALTKAQLPPADHEEATKVVKDIQTEVKKADPDPSRPGRVRRWLTSLASLCGPAADALKAASEVIAALGG